MWLVLYEMLDQFSLSNPPTTIDDREREISRTVFLVQMLKLLNTINEITEHVNYDLV